MTSIRKKGTVAGAFVAVAFVAAVVWLRIAEVRVQCSAQRISMGELQVALQRYFLDNGAYPTTWQGLPALADYYDEGAAGGPDPEMVLPRLFPKPPVDRWGHTLDYSSDGQSYVLKSQGPQGIWSNFCKPLRVAVGAASNLPNRGD